MGDMDRSLLASSTITCCDENDGPNVDSNASMDGNCDPTEFVLRGERGNLLEVLNDDAGMRPDTWDDVVDR